MKNLKFTFLLFLLIAGFCVSGCGSAQKLPSNAILGSEKARIDSYFGARNDHIAPFNNLHFYEVSDSIAGTIDPSLVKLQTVYKSIDQARMADSLWSGSDDFPLRVRFNLDINIIEAKGVAQ